MKSFDIYIAWLELDFAFYESNKALKKMNVTFQKAAEALFAFGKAWQKKIKQGVV